jgi:hypothetical protein
LATMIEDRVSSVSVSSLGKLKSSEMLKLWRDDLLQEVKSRGAVNPEKDEQPKTSPNLNPHLD